MPLSPFCSLEEREEERAAWLAGLDPGALEGLLDLLRRPPGAAERDGLDAGSFEVELTDALVAAGRPDPARALARLAPLVEDPLARPVVIDVLGALGSPGGIALLTSLVRRGAALTTDELVRLACALGEIGVDESRGLLQQMQTLPGAAHPEVEAEITIARSRLPGSPG